MRKILNINKNWYFKKNCHNIPTKIEKDWKNINLPHTWNNIDGQDGGGDYFRGTCLYAKTFFKNSLPKADKYFLEFQGVNSSANIYLNGNKTGEHNGGYSTFRVNITDYLQDENLIVVEVDNGVNDKVYPQMADFTFYGGIYRDVNIIATSATHFELEKLGTPAIKVTPKIKGKDAEVKIEVELNKFNPKQKLIYKIYDDKHKLVAQTKLNANQTKTTLLIEDVRLWNGKIDPYLYTAEVSLVESLKAIDKVQTKFGCRTFKIDANKGFILNGKNYPLRGVSRHQDYLGKGNALSKQDHKRDIDLILEMGANTIRLAHYQHDQYFYDLCDEKGLIIWAEIPYISSHMENGKENTISQMKELITQNYNHPSIVVWGLSNEITLGGKSTKEIIDNHALLNDLAHKMDKTRLTTLAAVSMCNIDDPYLQIPDVVSYNHYFGWYGGDLDMYGPWFDNFHQKYPNIPIGISEYGCEALNWHTSSPQQGDYTEEYQAIYHEALIKQLLTRPYIWATHVWNMFDFGADNRNEGGEAGQNHKGLITFDRKYKKDAFYAYKAWLSEEPFVHICGKRYINRVENTTKVTIYSNLPSVKLYINGKLFEEQKSKDHFFYFNVPNEGKTKLLAVAGNCKDVSLIKKVKKLDEKYILKETGAVLNWFDITAPDGYYSLNDKLSDILKSEDARNIVMNFIFQNISSSDMKIESNSGLMAMMSGFTLIRLINLIGSTMSKEFSRDDLLNMNEYLNKIKKI